MACNHDCLCLVSDARTKELQRREPAHYEAFEPRSGLLSLAPWSFKNPIPICRQHGDALFPPLSFPHMLLRSHDCRCAPFLPASLWVADLVHKPVCSANHDLAPGADYDAPATTQSGTAEDTQQLAER